MDLGERRCKRAQTAHAADDRHVLVHQRCHPLAVHVCAVSIVTCQNIVGTLSLIYPPLVVPVSFVKVILTAVSCCGVRLPLTLTTLRVQSSLKPETLG